VDPKENLREVIRAVKMPDWPATGEGLSGHFAKMQPQIDRVVTELVEYLNPLRVNLPRRPGSGDAWYLVRKTPSETPCVFVNDIEDLEESTGSYDQYAFPYRTIGCQGKVTRKAQAVGQTFGNLLAQVIENKTMEFKDKEDYAYIWGNYTNASEPAKNAKAFDGLNALAGLTIDMGGVALTRAKLDEAIDTLRGGNPDMVICSKSCRRSIIGLLQSLQRWVNVTEVKGGFKLPAYNDVPIYVSSNISNVLTSNGTNITGMTGGDTTVLFVIDTTKVFVGELTKLTVQPLAKTSSQFDAFDIFCDETMVSRDPQAVVRIINVKIA